jgi:hypothetical protein
VKITAVSDTHSKHAELNLTGGGLLIHAGDLSSRGLVHGVNDFFQWFSNQNYSYKIFIAGNRFATHHCNKTAQFKNTTCLHCVYTKNDKWLMDKKVSIDL